MTSGGFGLSSIASGLSKASSFTRKKSTGSPSTSMFSKVSSLASGLTGKKSTGSPSTGIFSKIKGAMSGLKSKATSKAEGSMMKSMGLDTSSLTSKFSSMFGSKKGVGALGGIGAIGAMGTMGAQGAPGHGIALPPSIFKIILLIFTSVLIGIFFSYIHNNETAFGANVFDQILVITSLVIAGLAISYIFKFGSIDFIISSEINILSFYMLASYIGLSSMASKGFFSNFLDTFKNIYDIITNPTHLFTKGFTVLVPLILFIIPVFVLLYDATQSIFLPFIVLAISVGVVYILYPKNDINPIKGGIGTSNSIADTTSDCTTGSSWNPLNWGKSKC